MVLNGLHYSTLGRIYSSPDELTEQRKLIQWENAIITTYFDNAKRKEDLEGISRKEFEK